jgi:hypothetical protein
MTHITTTVIDAANPSLAASSACEDQVFPNIMKRVRIGAVTNSRMTVMGMVQLP